MASKFDLKYLLVLGISVAALVMSALSWRNSTRLAEDAFTPRLSFTDLQLTATYPDDAESEETLLHYKIQNQGRLPMHDLHVAEVITTDNKKSVKQETRQNVAFEPGEPVDSVTYLTPTVVVPVGFTPDAVSTGKVSFSVQFETESSTERIPRYITCEKFHFNHFTGKFDRASTCTPEVFK
jgi:hypothetical protein